MTSLREVFENHRGRPIGKIDHYFDDYERFIAPLKARSVRVLEIGVDQGGSLELWQEYFGSGAQVHGIDIEPSAATNPPAGAHVHIGSQSDLEFLDQIVHQHGPFDLVIDDGSHMPDDQRATFAHLYPSLTPDGIYICEDSFTSYWSEYDGGPGVPGTFIEHTKFLIDELHNPWLPLEADASLTFAELTESITILSGSVIFVRGSRRSPEYVVGTGAYRSTMSTHELRSWCS